MDAAWGLLLDAHPELADREDRLPLAIVQLVARSFRCVHAASSLGDAFGGARLDRLLGRVGTRAHSVRIGI